MRAAWRSLRSSPSLIGANVGIARVRAQWDLTAEGSATLSEQTRRVLDEVDRRIEITAFFPRDALGRVEAATLLARYRRGEPPDHLPDPRSRLAPGEAQRLGVQEIGSAAVQDRGDRERIEIAQYTIEIDVTSAIARLVRGVDATVCFTTGHGERRARRPIRTDSPRRRRCCARNGYARESIDLLATTAVPRVVLGRRRRGAARRSSDEAAARRLSTMRATRGRLFSSPIRRRGRPHAAQRSSGGSRSLAGSSRRRRRLASARRSHRADRLALRRREPGRPRTGSDVLPARDGRAMPRTRATPASPSPRSR